MKKAPGNGAFLFKRLNVDNLLSVLYGYIITILYFCINNSRLDLFIILMSKTMLLPNKLKELREQCELPQRKVAAALDIDTATYCKIENGNYSPRKEQVIQLANILNANQDELVKLWLADKITIVAESEKDIAPEALKLVNDNYKRL